MVLFEMNVGRFDDAGGASCLFLPIVLTMRSIDGIPYDRNAHPLGKEPTSLESEIIKKKYIYIYISHQMGN